MGAIFQKKGKEMLKRAKYLKIWAKMYKIWKYFEKGQVTAWDNCMQQTDGRGPAYIGILCRFLIKCHINVC